MKQISKISLSALCLLNLTACAFTNNVLQSAYDNQAKAACQSADKSAETLDNSGNPRCNNGHYESKPKSN